MTQQYMFLLHDDEKWYDEMTTDSFSTEMELHAAFTAAVQAVGARILDGNALERSSMSTVVHRSPGAEPLITDGPFLETKEALGGYYVIEAADLDQALVLARSCPSAHVEVRPVMDIG